MEGIPGAAIINLGSIAGRTAYEGGAAYCGAKAAVQQIGLARALAERRAPAGAPRWRVW